MVKQWELQKARVNNVTKKKNKRTESGRKRAE